MRTTILMVDNLNKRGHTLPNVCLLCRRDKESVDHLLIHCDFAKEEWYPVLENFGVSWEFPKEFKASVGAWRIQRVLRKRKVLWKSLLQALC